MSARSAQAAHAPERPLVVVGQESGYDKNRPEFRRRVTVEARYRQVYELSGRQSRYYARDGKEGRNPHMKGTTSALRVIFGKGLDTDYDGEWVHPANGEPFHIFDGFALVNRLLCSAGPLGTSSGAPTPTMLTNCRGHFAKTLSYLRPTVLIFQSSPAAANWTSIFTSTHTIRAGLLHEAQLEQTRTLVCTFSHPTARDIEGKPPLRWGDQLTRPYLTNVVEPTLREAIRLL
jgi:hypothetical protein